METITNEYVPGVCNIGGVEIKRRRQLGWSGLVVAALMLFLFILFHFAPLWRLLLFFPATLSASGFIQANAHFCTGFGAKGVYNFDKVLRKTTAVENKEFIGLDKKRSKQLTTYSVLIGIVVALAAYFI